MATIKCWFWIRQQSLNKTWCVCKISVWTGQNSPQCCWMMLTMIDQRLLRTTYGDLTDSLHFTMCMMGKMKSCLARRPLIGCLWHRLQVKASWGKILTLKLLPMALPLVCQGVCVSVCVRGILWWGCTVSLLMSRLTPRMAAPAISLWMCVVKCFVGRLDKCYKCKSIYYLLLFVRWNNLNFCGMWIGVMM